MATRESKRFWLKVKQGAPDDCWEWQGARGRYGYLKWGTRLELAHRVSWGLHFGVIPDGLKVLHLCDNPLCVNPKHLFLGTQSDNMQDMWRKKRHPNSGRKGEAHPGAKLTWEQVATIRRRWQKGGVTQRQLGREYGVSGKMIGRIVNGDAWK